MTAKIKLNAASGGGSFSLQAPSSSANTRVMTLPDTADGTILTTTNPKAGNVIQVVQTVKTDTTSLATIDTWTDISGMSVSITPSSSSNKILITAVLNTGHKVSSYYSLRLEKDGTAIAIGDAASNRSRGYFGQGPRSNSELIDNTTINFLDTAGSTSAITYNIAWYIAHESGSTLYLNRTFGDPDADYGQRTISTITAMEIAA